MINWLSAWCSWCSWDSKDPLINVFTIDSLSQANTQKEEEKKKKNPQWHLWEDEVETWHVLISGGELVCIYLCVHTNTRKHWTFTENCSKTMSPQTMFPLCSVTFTTVGQIKELSYLILSLLILSYLILSHLILSYLNLSHLILSHLMLFYLISSHLILRPEGNQDASVSYLGFVFTIIFKYTRD